MSSTFGAGPPLKPKPKPEPKTSSTSINLVRGTTTLADTVLPYLIRHSRAQI
jgi:hypothetical protein